MSSSVKKKNTRRRTSSKRKRSRTLPSFYRILLLIAIAALFLYLLLVISSMFRPAAHAASHASASNAPAASPQMKSALPVYTPDPTPSPSPTPSPTPVPTPTPVVTLRKGAEGEEVRRLQEALIRLGYLDDAADGNFGSRTESAVCMFQAVNHLTADGLAGQKTLALLYSDAALPASAAPKTDFLILVNRDYPLDKGYVPSDLMEISDCIPGDVLKVKYKGTKANRYALEALRQMLEAAISDGISNWQVSSAYRTYKEQQRLVDNSVSTYLRNHSDWSRKQALSATYHTVAPAGTSEHQTGLAFDITVPGVNFTGTEQQKWMHEHCHEYGFIVRYTKDKESKTGFIAESWHFRYVGREAAEIIKRNNWCLEEYLEAVPQ